MIVVADYGRGNLFSIGRALEHLGVEFALSDRPEALTEADAIILPGVGAFGDAMDALVREGLAVGLVAAARAGVPILGICLGMQLLFSDSEEFGDHGGLDLIGGKVRRLPEGDGGRGSVRIPNVGWRAIGSLRESPLTAGMAPGAMFYFVHSYVPFPSDPRSVVATSAINGFDAAVLVQRGNVMGCQFHPEKSGPAGLAMLDRFCHLSIRPHAVREPA